MFDALETFYLFCLIGGPLMFAILVVLVLELTASGFFRRWRP